MSRRRHRYPTEEHYRAIEGRQLLERLGEARREVTRSRKPLNSEIRDRADAITAAIDAFAEVITGDRRHFIPNVPRTWHSSEPPAEGHDPMQAEPTRGGTPPQDRD